METQVAQAGLLVSSLAVNIIFAMFIVRLLARISAMEKELKDIAKMTQKYLPKEKKKEEPQPPTKGSYWRLKDQR